MSKFKKKLIGQIGFCENSKLGIKDKNGSFKGGHYVFIREVTDDGKCNVNVITSLENKQGEYQIKKLGKVKNGYLYPIPKGDADFSQWSAINLDGNINGIKVSDIKQIGFRKIKKRHRFFVGKFTKIK